MEWQPIGRRVVQPHPVSRPGAGRVARGRRGGGPRRSDAAPARYGAGGPVDGPRPACRGELRAVARRPRGRPDGRAPGMAARPGDRGSRARSRSPRRPASRQPPRRPRTAVPVVTSGSCRTPPSSRRWCCRRRSDRSRGARCRRPWVRGWRPSCTCPWRVRIVAGSRGGRRRGPGRGWPSRGRTGASRTRPPRRAGGRPSPSCDGRAATGLPHVTRSGTRGAWPADCLPGPLCAALADLASRARIPLPIDEGFPAPPVPVRRPDRLAVRAGRGAHRRRRCRGRA